MTDGFVLGVEWKAEMGGVIEEARTYANRGLGLVLNYMGIFEIMKRGAFFFNKEEIKIIPLCFFVTEEKGVCVCVFIALFEEKVRFWLLW